MALDYKVIMGRVMRAAKCSRDDAWTAIAEVYASGRADTSRSEGELANWFVKSATFAVMSNRRSQFEQAARSVDTDVQLSEDCVDLWDTIAAPADTDTQTQQLFSRLLKNCVPQYRLGLAVVLHHIFNARFVCALTIESIRQILKRAGLTAAASDQAANIYTYLNTYQIT